MMKEQHRFIFLTLSIVLFVLLLVFSAFVSKYEFFSAFMIISLAGAIVFLVIFIKKNNRVRAVYKKYKKLGIEPSDMTSNKPVIPPLIEEFDKAVRIHFLRLPFDEYHIPLGLIRTLESEVKSGKPTTITLQAILIDMERHLGMQSGKSIINLERVDGNQAGLFERKDYTFNDITVGYCDVYGTYNYLGILAHELSHSYQHHFSKEAIFDRDKQELFTDFLTFYLGFGRFTKRGKNAKKVDQLINGTRTRTCTIGYLDEGYFPYIELCVDRLKMEKETAEQEKIENAKIIRKIEELNKVAEFYFETIELQLDRLRNVNIPEDLFSKVQNLFLKYDSSYLAEIHSKCEGYKGKNLSSNKELLSYLETAVEEMMNDSSMLQQIN